MRVPDLSLLAAHEPVPTLAEVSARWLASRIDLRESSLTQYRVALGRGRSLDDRPIDRITAPDVVELVATLVDAGKARESIRKTVSAVAAMLDFAGIEPNPARDHRVRLPCEDRDQPEPPDAATVEAVARRLPVAYLIALAALDISRRRLNELVKAKLGDFDEDHHRWLIRARVSKTKRPSWGVICDDMVDGTALLNALAHVLPVLAPRPPAPQDLAPAQARGVRKAASSSMRVEMRNCRVAMSGPVPLRRYLESIRPRRLMAFDPDLHGFTLEFMAIANTRHIRIRPADT